MWMNLSLYPGPVPAPGLLPVAEPEKGSTMELETAPVMFQPSPQASEPASPPSAVPELEQVLTSSSAYVPGPQLQSAQSSALLRILTPALKIETEPTPAPEPSCHGHVTPKNQLNEEKPSLMDFPPKLVAEQLTYIDAVRSWALRAGQGRALSTFLPSANPDLPFPDVDYYSPGPNFSSTTYQPCYPAKVLKSSFHCPAANCRDRH